MTNQTTPQDSATDTAETDPGMVHEYLQHLWRMAQEEINAYSTWRGRPRATLTLTVMAAGALVTAFIVISLLSWIGRGIADLADRVGTWGGARDLAAVVTRPVHAYLQDHSAGLPISADALWWTWLVAGAVLLLLAMARSVGARIGWALFGIATTAMVWQSTPAPSAITAAALTTLAWIVLTVPAYRRGSSGLVIRTKDLELEI
ncbi:MAG: hypothetical protein QG622_3201 [Actinomycetota bacterium]|nr:hypothetical protein [Actinomycetota bacterium]